jgi:flagellar protein FliO/FliZ
MNTTHSLSLRRRAVLCLLLMMPVAGVLGQGRDSAAGGDFDIAKVRQAVGQNAFRPGAADTLSGAQGSPQTPAEQESLVLIILRITGFLVLVLLLIFLIAWGARKAGLAGGSKVGGGSMDVLEALPLGQNRALLLVRVTDRVYLLGQSQSRIDMLETYESDKALEIISSTKGGVSMMQFKDVFGSFMGKLRKTSS